MSRAVSIACLMTALAGCGPARPDLAELTGTVSFEGQPLEQGTIYFEGPGTRPARGTIASGKIVNVTTYQAGDGAPLGPKLVAVQSTKLPTTTRDGKPLTPNAMLVGIPLIPDRYFSPKTSGLKCEIKPGLNEIQLELTNDER